MREYVKNVIEGLFQDVLAAGGPLNHDHWSYGGGGDGVPQQSYEQLKRGFEPSLLVSLPICSSIHSSIHPFILKANLVGKGLWALSS
jgi:hypothetical protein